ncbi:MAG: hypothetical protein RSE55_02745 [Lachnospiraceae bacterium]
MPKQKMVCDFQLVYATDCMLHFDLYAAGLIKEPENIETEAEFHYLDYGMIYISDHDYKLLNEKMQKIVQDPEMLIFYIKKMIASIFSVIEENKRMEAEMEQGEFGEESIKRLLYSMIEVMSYRRLSDLATEELSAKINMQDLAKMKVPSYILLLKEKLSYLNGKSSEEEFNTYIFEYSYLHSFNISATKYEDKAYLKSLVQTNESGPILKPMDIKYQPPENCGEELRLLYDLSWYSELKHIYQLRTLRNTRRYMQQKEFNIYNTGLRKLVSYDKEIS